MRNSENRTWSAISNSQSYNSWVGNAFENICHIHIIHIKKILGILGVNTQNHYWNYRPKNSSERGSQIDMMIEHTNVLSVSTTKTSLASVNHIEMS